MKLYISVDFEGIAGIVHWDQILPDRRDYAVGRSLLVGEINAAVRGAMTGGATDIVVNDSHAHMRNVLPEDLVPDARLILGHFKPMYMMEGLDDSFDAIMFLAYHGEIGARDAVLTHSYNPHVIWEARIDGRVTGEIGLNLLVARHYGVPVVLVTGDTATAREAEEWIPGVATVAVKESCSRYASNSMSPTRARDLIYEAARRAVSGYDDAAARQQRDGPVTLDLTFTLADMATLASWLPGIERTGDRTVRLRCEDGLSAYRTFYAVLLLARAAADE